MVAAAAAVCASQTTGETTSMSTPLSSAQEPRSNAPLAAMVWRAMSAPPPAAMMASSAAILWGGKSEEATMQTRWCEKASAEVASRAERCLQKLGGREAEHMVRVGVRLAAHMLAGLTVARRGRSCG